ncbi:hypothetical protein GCM10009639_62080 [Kitasatospora putterlickiae]|uniref:Uncharacterized protein n=1 Tax=Kitasatospora putterlickiae TaxID=221725 RepID=A0ABN1YFV4_9ACTN
MARLWNHSRSSPTGITARATSAVATARPTALVRASAAQHPSGTSTYAHPSTIPTGTPRPTADIPGGDPSAVEGSAVGGRRTWAGQRARTASVTSPARRGSFKV